MGQRLSWGVLGTANIARSQVVPAIRSSTNGCVAAVAGRHVSRTRDFAKLFGIDTAFESYAALIASPEIDAVYIPLPNSLHADWAIKAANAGKAVLCEKPLALNGDEAQGVVDAFSNRGVPLMEGFMYRFHPQNLHVLKLVAEGVIGDVREVRSHLSVQIMDPPDTGNVRFNAVLGGGSLLDMGCYAINVARHVMGDEPGSVMGSLYTDTQFGVDISAAAILEFGDGRTAAISSSFCAGGQGVYQVIGTKGVIEVPRAIILGMGSRLGEGLVVVVDGDGRRTETRFEAVDQYRLMVEAFAAAVLSGAPVPYDPRDSIRNLRVCDAIVASHRSGSRAEVRS